MDPEHSGLNDTPTFEARLVARTARGSSATPYGNAAFGASVRHQEAEPAVRRIAEISGCIAHSSQCRVRPSERNDRLSQSGRHVARRNLAQNGECAIVPDSLTYRGGNIDPDRIVRNSSIASPASRRNCHDVDPSTERSFGYLGGPDDCAISHLHANIMADPTLGDPLVRGSLPVRRIRQPIRPVQPVAPGTR